MIGYRPSAVIKCCWLFLTPATCFVGLTVILNIHVSSTPLWEESSLWWPVLKMHFNLHMTTNIDPVSLLLYLNSRWIRLVFKVGNNQQFYSISLTRELLSLLPGHLRLRLDQVLTSEVQQWICLPMVGQWDRLDPGSVLHAVYPCLGSSETVLHPWNAKRGTYHLSTVHFRSKVSISKTSFRWLLLFCLSHLLFRNE